MIRHSSVSVTATGGAGTSSGSGVTNLIIGKILAIHLDYSAGAATTDVTIATTAIPVQNILVRTDSVTDGWFYPRVALHDTAAAAITYDGTRPVHDYVEVTDYITASVAQANNAQTLTVTILYEGT